MQSSIFMNHRSEGHVINIGDFLLLLSKTKKHLDYNKICYYILLALFWLFTGIFLQTFVFLFCLKEITIDV